jgi:hypothetical protein
MCKKTTNRTNLIFLPDLWLGFDRMCVVRNYRIIRVLYKTETFEFYEFYNNRTIERERGNKSEILYQNRAYVTKILLHITYLIKVLKFSY